MAKKKKIVAVDPAPASAPVAAPASVDPAPVVVPEPAPVETPSSASVDGIEVGDPQVLRPVELPLVVKPANGGAWANDAQAEYAKVLNAYAYKNPTKFAKKKAVLIKQLAKLATDPQSLNVLKGEMALDGEGQLAFKNKLIEK